MFPDYLSLSYDYDLIKNRLKHEQITHLNFLHGAGGSLKLRFVIGRFQTTVQRTEEESKNFNCFVHAFNQSYDFMRHCVPARTVERKSGSVLIVE